jgi:hypothetical protein
MPLPCCIFPSVTQITRSFTPHPPTRPTTQLQACLKSASNAVQRILRIGTPPHQAHTQPSDSKITPPLVRLMACIADLDRSTLPRSTVMRFDGQKLKPVSKHPCLLELFRPAKYARQQRQASNLESLLEKNQPVTLNILYDLQRTTKTINNLDKAFRYLMRHTPAPELVLIENRIVDSSQSIRAIIAELTKHLPERSKYSQGYIYKILSSKLNNIHESKFREIMLNAYNSHINAAVRVASQSDA